jgi:hypothetical protein
MTPTLAKKNYSGQNPTSASTREEKFIRQRFANGINGSATLMTSSASLNESHGTLPAKVACA